MLPNALPAYFGIGRGPRLHVEDAHLEDVAGLGAPHGDRAGADMHAQALAGAAAEERGVHRPGAAAVHALLVLGPEKTLSAPGSPLTMRSASSLA